MSSYEACVPQRRKTERGQGSPSMRSKARVLSLIDVLPSLLGGEGVRVA